MHIRFKLIFILLCCIWQIACFASVPNNTTVPNNKCVQIYYDRINPAFNDGRAAALVLQNLLGHFPNIQRYVIPIEMYKKNQLERCYASFYLGSTNNSAIPPDFFQDYAKTKKNVIWMQHNIWKLDPKILQQLWMVQFRNISYLDWQHLDAKGQPGFYRFYQYKGQVFPSYGDFDEDDPKKFLANYLVVLMQPLNDKAKTYVDSWVKHSTTNQMTPFILHNGNHWYVAQVPFSYITKEGQYMIFADLLFDMIGEQPRYKGKKPALVRIEDVNIGFDTPDQIITLADLFHKYDFPFSIALIPIFEDPFKVLNTTSVGPVTNNYGMIYALHYAQDHGASFIFEGVTHQYDHMKNPYNGMTGPDYEFWDMVNDRPVKEDSPLYILNRLQRGADVIADAGFKPSAWLTPHYRASILDYVMFAQLFNWAVEAKFYVPMKVEQKSKLPVSLNFDNYWPGSVALRAPYFNSLKVTYDQSLPQETFLFPYEIYGDYYGQRVMPENVGYITPKPNQLVQYNETVDDMIRIIKRNTVLRDVWASFFIHPILLQSTANGGLAKYPGDTSELERLLSAIKTYGYQFIDLDSWTKQHMELAPPTIEIYYQ